MVMRGKSNLCALRPGDKGLMLTTMQYADEIVAAPKVEAARHRAKPALRRRAGKLRKRHA